MISHEEARSDIKDIEITLNELDNMVYLESIDSLKEYISQQEQQSNDIKRLIYLYSISYDTVRQSERYFSKSSYEENKYEHEYKHEYDVRMQKEMDELKQKLLKGDIL